MADGAQLFEVTLAEMIAEVDREVAMRREVYARRVADGRMRQETAERQIAVMEAVAKRLSGDTQDAGALWDPSIPPIARAIATLITQLRKGGYDVVEIGAAQADSPWCETTNIPRGDIQRVRLKRVPDGDPQAVQAAAEDLALRMRMAWRIAERTRRGFAEPLPPPDPAADVIDSETA